VSCEYCTSLGCGVKGKGSEIRRFLEDSHEREDHHERDRDASESDSVDDSGDDGGSDAIGGGVAHGGIIPRMAGNARGREENSEEFQWIAQSMSTNPMMKMRRAIMS
jgi:hypothetical protein